MACRRCSMCSKNYDTKVLKCPECGAGTWYLVNDEPDGELVGSHGQTTIEDERLRVINWRFEQFCEMGFEPRAADELANDGSDVHSVRRALELGATHQKVLEIFR